MIEAPDLEAAKEIAMTLPPGRSGTVEVRRLFAWVHSLAPLWTNGLQDGIAFA